MITVWIDEFTPCLIDNATGAYIDTEVVRIKRKSFLSNYNKRTGWFENWGNLAKQNEIYALVLKGTMDIQGLVALRLHEESKEVFVEWICANPKSNPSSDLKQYNGIGGHLFAIAIDRSMQLGKNGEFYGFAANNKLYEHYQKKLLATPIGILHEYHFIMESTQARKILEEYTYEWTDEEV